MSIPTTAAIMGCRSVGGMNVHVSSFGIHVDVPISATQFAAERHYRIECA